MVGVIFTSRAMPGMLGLFYFAGGGEFYNTCDQCTLKQFFPIRGNFRQDSRAPHIMGNVGNVQFVLFLSVGAARGAKMQRIENRKGGGALAFHGRRFNKVGILGGDNIWEGARPWCKMWEGCYPIDWGGKSGDNIIEEKNNMLWSSGVTNDKKHTTTN